MCGTELVKAEAIKGQDWVGTLQVPLKYLHSFERQSMRQNMKSLRVSKRYVTAVVSKCVTSVIIHNCARLGYMKRLLLLFVWVENSVCCCEGETNWRRWKIFLVYKG